MLWKLHKREWGWVGGDGVAKGKKKKDFFQGMKEY